MYNGKSFGQSLTNKFLGSGEVASRPLDPTISKDRTKGDDARKRALLAEFGRKLKPRLAGPSSAAAGGRRGESSFIPASQILAPDGRDLMNILVADYERACRRDQATGVSSERETFLERYATFDTTNPLPTVAEVRSYLDDYIQGQEGTIQLVREDLATEVGRENDYVEMVRIISANLQKQPSPRSGWQATVKHEDRRNLVVDLAIGLRAEQPYFYRSKCIESALQTESRVFNTSIDKLTWEKRLRELQVAKLISQTGVVQPDLEDRMLAETKS